MSDGKEEEIDRVREQFQKETETAQKKEWNGQWYIELLPKHCGKERGGDSEPVSEDQKGEEHELRGWRQRRGYAESFRNRDRRRGGSRKLKECADAVCESPMDDGIYRELERRGILSGENGTGERREKKAEEREKEICAEEHHVGDALRHKAQTDCERQR